ncbi:MAG: phosphoserine aminotransferase, partial [Holosporales bacterium]|nr:phosphoserine aminotransferase [Holosporales bacterium]
MEPLLHPRCASFSSGPCAKPPGWSAVFLQDALVGRSHRSPAAVEKLHAMEKYVRRLLAIPEEYRLAILSGSTTGAMETAFWNLLGPREVDVLAYDVFGHVWTHDIQKQLGLNTRIFSAP